MALAATIVLEVRTTGADTNGGGFKTGATGTDHSQQDAAQYAVTDGVTDGTTTITSATANFGTDVVGNLIYVTGGTGSVAADWYEITARGSATSITVDRSTGLTAGTGVTLNIGGALASPGQAAAIANKTAGISVWMKTGTYSIGTGTVNTSGNKVAWTVGSSAGGAKWIAYSVTRGDRAAYATMQASGASITLFTSSGGYNYLEGLAFDGNAQTSSRGLDITSEGLVVAHCKALGCTNNGFRVAARAILRHCYATTCSAQAAFLVVAGASLFACVAYANTITGISCAGAAFVHISIINCISANNTGASSYGFITDAAYQVYTNCVARGNGSDGVRINGQISWIINGLACNNGGYGFNNSGASVAHLRLINCAGVTNTSGNVSASLTQNEGFITLSADPFTNGAGGDFSLNNTAGGGAACRAAGIPGAFPGISTTGYIDIGAVQHADPAGGGGSIFASPVIT